MERICKLAPEEIQRRKEASAAKKCLNRSKAEFLPPPTSFRGREISYYHIRNKKYDKKTKKYINLYNGGVTVVILDTRSTSFIVGLGLCSVVDNFCRMKGRHYAYENLVAADVGSVNPHHRVQLYLKYEYKMNEQNPWCPKFILQDIANKVLRNEFKTSTRSLVV